MGFKYLTMFISSTWYKLCMVERVNCTRQIMTCEPIDIIYCTLGIVMKGHTESWGSPMVLYCTVCNCSNLLFIISISDAVGTTINNTVAS